MRTRLLTVHLPALLKAWKAVRDLSSSSANLTHSFPSNQQRTKTLPRRIYNLPSFTNPSTNNVGLLSPSSNSTFPTAYSPSTTKLANMSVDSSARSTRHSRLAKKDKICTASQLYTYPTASSSAFDASSGDITFTWDPDCTIATKGKVDISLYAPNLPSSLIKIFTNVDQTTGSYSVALLPKWWNATTSASLSITISDADSSLPSYLQGIVAGPPFTVTYPASLLQVAATGTATGSVAAAAADTAAVDSIVYDAASSGKSGLPAGSVAAAALIPILVLLTGIFFYVRWIRAKQAKKRERWSQAIDNRMSVISQHWQPGTSTHRPSGSMHRPSMSTQRNTRGESVFDNGRASSTFAVENNMAGRGTNQHHEQPEMSQRGGDRPSFARGASYIDRQSRDSQFAASPSGRAISMFDDGKRNRVSFAPEEAGHRASRVSFGDALRPTHSNHSGLSSQAGKGKSSSIHSLPHKSTPPKRSFQSERERAEEMNVSPIQAQGPFVLGEDDVDGRGRPSVDEGLRSMEAVMLMRKQQSGNATRVSANNEGMEEVLSEQQLRPSGSTHRTSSFGAASPLSQHIALPSPPLAATSTLIPGGPLSSSTSITPDDALRAYAQRSAHANGGTPRFELGQNERGLGFGATPSTSPAMTSPGGNNRLSVASGVNNPFRNSMLSDNSRYSSHSGGNANNHPHQQ
ncbi:hypothetical protein BDY24DRAFT_414408 [Mrakia frigida]|uniref:uncharacterized protein n=1 Tax=Mrakia frigida TaxID=29902 RepID=UPI003FCC21B0